MAISLNFKVSNRTEHSADYEMTMAGDLKLGLLPGGDNSGREISNNEDFAHFLRYRFVDLLEHYHELFSKSKKFDQGPFQLPEVPNLSPEVETKVNSLALDYADGVIELGIVCCVKGEFGLKGESIQQLRDDQVGSVVSKQVLLDALISIFTNAHQQIDDSGDLSVKMGTIHFLDGKTSFDHFRIRQIKDQ